jgi:hypothetical protein
MRYWGLFVTKLGVAAATVYLVWLGMTSLLPAPHLYRNQFFGYDLPWTFAAGFLFLLGWGLVSLSILDQRYRCRVCARRLRMPILTGSWGQMLQLGRPRIEYICPFGHGTLKVDQLQVSGLESPDWKQHEDMWKELFSIEDRRK